MEIFSVCFFGHRRIENFDLVEKNIYEIVGNLIQTKDYIEFLVGRNGDFDQIASSCIKRAKKNIFESNSSLTLILPYKTAEYRNNQHSFEAYYDSIEIIPGDNTYFKNIYQKRNRKMIDRADLCVFCVNHNYGGAYMTLKYAENQHKRIINILIG